MEDNKVILKAIKIGLLGDSQVGKTAICNALLNAEFNPDVITTIGYVKLETKFKLKDGNEIKLILWDSAGQERFRSVALNALRAVRGIVVVFDVTKRETFTNVETWLSEIKENFNNPCLVLFGNKIDKDKSEWEVSEEEIKKFAEEKHLVYFETSALTKKGINEGFDYIVNEAYEKAKGVINKNIVLEEPSQKENDPTRSCRPLRHIGTAFQRNCARQDRRSGLQFRHRRTASGFPDWW